jgi:hypothetical protein
MYNYILFMRLLICLYFDFFFIDMFKNKTKKPEQNNALHNATMYFLLPDLETKFNYHILVLIMNLVFPVLIDL